LNKRLDKKTSLSVRIKNVRRGTQKERGKWERWGEMREGMFLGV
jgi:hypothetical protein